MTDSKKSEILSFIQNHPNCSTGEIHQGLVSPMSYATVKRILSQLLIEQYILAEGKGKGTRYSVSSRYVLLYSIDSDSYFEKEVDERHCREGSNFDIFDLVDKTPVFTDVELEKLADLQKKFADNSAQLTPLEYAKELERLAIDLSWKSSQIEGNTYSLLETERLLKDRETASGKTKEEAIMLLNHKDTIDFIVENPDYVDPLAISKIEDIHSLLMKDLAVDKNLRKGRVGITGTKYRPLDNEFQLRDALDAACLLVNKKDNAFEKALLIIVLISYIQPFMDGNKRTARIVGNAILMHHQYCPLSYRTVDSVDYKKAMLLFYEQNNLSGFKQIFLSQFEFAVKTYF